MVCRGGCGESPEPLKRQPHRTRHMKKMVLMHSLIVFMMTLGEARAVPTLPTVAGQSAQQMTVTVTGELRDFTLSVPAGFETCYAARYCRRHQFPLIILLHGRGQSRARAM